MALLEFPSQTILGIDFRSTCLESVLRILKVAGESSSMSARLIHMKWHELRQGENSKFLVALFAKGPDLWCERSQQDVISLVEDLLHLTKRVKESMNMAWSSIVGLWGGGPTRIMSFQKKICKSGILALWRAFLIWHGKGNPLLAPEVSPKELAWKRIGPSP